MKQGIKAEVIERVSPGGERFLVERLESVMPVSGLPCDPDYKEGCGPCEMRGRNLACPPYSPYIVDYIGQAREAMVVCYRLHMEQIENVIPEEAYEQAYEFVRSILVEELLGWRAKGHIVAGSGPCHACKECVAGEGGRECRFPDRMIYSLESMGVSVVLLSEYAFGISLDWSGTDTSADTVSALGAVFMPQVEYMQ